MKGIETMLSHLSRPARSRVRAAVIPLLSLSVGMALVSPAAAADAQRAPRFNPAHAAARWQGGELDRSGAIPSSFGGGFKDWGLTVDTAFALAADRQRPKQLAAARRAIAGHWYDDYVTFQASPSSQLSISANAAAKTLVVAKVLKRHPRHFGGHNVRRMVLNRVLDRGAGAEFGRLADKTTGGSSDFSNTFGQAFGVIGLARTGHVPPEVVRYLLKQRCRTGYFRIDEVAGKTCGQSGSRANVDATALAIQALIAARHDGVRLRKGLLSRSVGWLASVQKANGSFSVGGGARGSNSNSTGLAAQALQAAKRFARADQAGAWVRSLQITRAKAGRGPAAKDIGAIAFNRADLRDALKHGLTDTSRSKFQRATPQAFFALHPTPLGKLSAP